jgi:hypothetical protein
MIACLCPACGSQLSAEEQPAGRTMKCPTCGGVVQVPAAGTVPIIVAEHHAERGRHNNGTVPLARPTAAAARIHDVEARKLLPMDAPARLDRQSHYLICGDTHLAASWQNNGRGWMLHTDFGLISATLNPEQLPSQGNFKLIELKLKMTAAGLSIEDLLVYQLADRWALTNLDRNDDRILTAVVGRAGLGRAQKDAVRDAIHQTFMRELWEPAHKVMNYLANADYHSHGTR